MSENRRFGWMMALFLLAWAGAHFWRTGSVAIVPVAAAALLAIAAAVLPSWLELPRKSWIRLGEILGRINQPIILGIIFYALITPVGFLRRRLGYSKIDWRAKDDHWRLGRSTYWQTEDTSQTNHEQKYSWKNLRRQF